MGGTAQLLSSKEGPSGTADLINYRSDSHKKTLPVSVRMFLNDPPAGGF